MARPRVLLIGWDAADWKVIDPLLANGQMPNLARLIRNGSSGHIATLHPPLSPMLWTSIATGKRPHKHGVLGFTEPKPNGLGIRPVTNLSRRTKAIWNILNQNGLRSVVYGWWPSNPVEPIDGVMVSDHFGRAVGPIDTEWPIADGTVHPPVLSEKLAGLRVHPESLSPALVERFVPRAREIDQEKDTRLGFLLRTIAECMSVHAASKWLIENEQWDFFATYHDSIDHFSHAFMRYHAPRQAWINQRDFDLYQGVVPMAYRLHDELLGELVARAGRETTTIVMSDHGFHSDHLRPSSIPDIPAGPAIEHRDLGVLAMRGPGIRNGGRLYSASVLDVAPTILTIFGLPTGEDMDGKVLASAFRSGPEIDTVPSWDAVPGQDGCHPECLAFDPAASQAALEQMIALGYIERPDAAVENATRQSARELRFNLAASLQDAGLHPEARQIFKELYEAAPGEQRFAVGLFASCQALGLHEEMRTIAVVQTDKNLFDYLTAQVLIAERQFAGALVILKGLDHPHLRLLQADLHFRLRQNQSAKKLYAEELQADPDSSTAWLGLCRIAVRARKFDDALDAALNAAERSWQDPHAHFLLGRILEMQRRYSDAADAYALALSVNPNFSRTRLRLARLIGSCVVA